MRRHPRRLAPGPSLRWAIPAGALALVVAQASLASTTDCGDTPGDWRAGRAIYQRTCIACHGEDGRGASRGVPDFTAGVMAYSSASLATHIEHGFRAPGRPRAMPPKGGDPNLTAADILDVLAYLHHAFGCG